MMKFEAAVLTATHPQHDQQHFLQTALALALGSFTCFLLLYGTQAILPQLTRYFSISPSAASLSVAAGTGAMAIFLIPLSLAADRFGRERFMKLGLLGAVLFAFTSAIAPTFFLLLLSKIALGACVACVPAAAMAYIGEEIPQDIRGKAMGIYIAGNALGGMSGRLISGAITGWLDWRYAQATLGLVGLISIYGFWRWLPPAQHFSPASLHPQQLWADIRSIYANPHLPKLFTIAFLVMGSFVGLYNYLGFRLSAAPYYLGPSAIGSIFLIYALGSISSAKAGQLADKIGHQAVSSCMCLGMLFGIGITLSNSFVMIILGVTLFTTSYFAMYAVLSAWIGHCANQRKALVSALYLSSCYLGSSVLGSGTGIPFNHSGWPAFSLTLTAIILIALFLIMHSKNDK